MHAGQDCWFDHEKLEVYREAIAFVAWVSALLEGAVGRRREGSAGPGIHVDPAEHCRGQRQIRPQGSLPLL